MGVVIAIDGPAGAGKSSVAQLLARRLGYTLVDTGAIYRAVALLALRAGHPLDDASALAAIVERLEVEFRDEGDVNRVLVGGEDVTEAIRRPEVSAAASTVSAQPVVRAGLLSLQRRLGGQAPVGAVLEGRDVGTVIFPDAPVKIFLVADPLVRASRRARELEGRGQAAALAEVDRAMRARDEQDRSRPVSPLKMADDAVLIDSSALSLDEVVAQIEAVVRERLVVKGSG